MDTLQEGAGEVPMEDCCASLTLAMPAYEWPAVQYALTSQLIICRQPVSHSQAGLTDLHKPLNQPSDSAQATTQACTSASKTTDCLPDASLSATLSTGVAP